MHQLLTAVEVQNALTKAAGPDAVLQSYTVKRFSAGEIGYFGEHCTIQVKYQENNTDKEISFFVKCVPNNETFCDFMIKSGMFAKEQECYETLLPIVSENLNKAKLPIPDCFLICTDTFLVFEDLQTSGFKLADKYECLDLPHCKSVIEAIAYLHAGSIAAEVKTGKMMAFNMKNPQEVIVTEEGAQAATNITASWHAASMASVLGLMLKMEEFKSRISGVAKETLERKLNELWRQSTDMAKGFSSKFANVLSHGDLWVNNILFKSESDGKIKACLVDFQNYRYAPPILDLLSFLHLTTSRKLRQDHQSELLQFYHTTVAKILTEADVNPLMAPTLDELEKSASELRLFGIAIAAKYMPTVLKQQVAPEKLTTAAERDGMPQEYIRDSSDLIIQSFEQSPIMKSRIVEVLEELVDFIEL